MDGRKGPNDDPGLELIGTDEADGGLTRRAMLGGSVVAVAVLAGAPFGRGSAMAVPVSSGKPTFLTDEEMQRLRALVDAFVPGPPVDTDPGALASGCADAIDALLGAFQVDPPRIYAGAPFSNRDGSRVDYFEHFLSLDDYEATAWRLRVEGSRGNPALEFNGPIVGWQQVYRDGLAALPAFFADLPEPAREALLRSSNDAAVKALVDVAFPHTYQFIYGAPEYGGNKALIGWTYTAWPGDMQPNGFTAQQVEQPDDGAPLLTSVEQDLLKSVMAIAPLGGSPELTQGLVLRSGDSLAALTEELAPIHKHAPHVQELARTTGGEGR